MKAPHRLAAALAAAALVLTACGDGGTGDNGDTGNGDTGAQPTGDPILIGAIFDLTGPTSDVGVQYAGGIQAYWEWVNDNGGIDGRPIELLHADYAYDVGQAEQLYSQYSSRGVVAFSGWGTADTEVLRTKITADEIPFVSASYSEELVDPSHTPYNFVAALTYSDQMRIALQHLASLHEGEHVEVAVFHHDSPFGLSPVQDGADYIDEQGYDMGYQSYAMPGGAADYFGELSRAASQGDGGADYIIVQNVPSPAAQLARNIEERALDATIVCLNWCANEGFVELAGAAAEGSLGVLPFVPPAAVESELGDVLGHLAARGRGIDDIQVAWTAGWYTMHLVAEGIRAVVANGDEVTGPNVRAAMETMGPINTPVAEAIEFTTDNHSGMKSGRVYQVEGGVWTSPSDALTP